MLEGQPCAFESEVVRDGQGKARHRRGGGERRLRAVRREPVRALPVIRAELGIVAAQQPPSGRRARSRRRCRRPVRGRGRGSWRTRSLSGRAGRRRHPAATRCACRTARVTHPRRPADGHRTHDLGAEQLPAGQSVVTACSPPLGVGSSAASLQYEKAGRAGRRQADRDRLGHDPGSLRSFLPFCNTF
ncbi:conserved hypothetical protein [Rhodococcus jostii RHA1]|uniref:Uncharacterized protein n=1 Tax=Rhodococcus jostii (strain RHA1) TaxID=101510 RepID=Q0S8Z2_RHOJR|nr:conserved hypothetical protein [Rhodococcus jostii RHA1]